jgi:hypothetical protein
MLTLFLVQLKMCVAAVNFFTKWCSKFVATFCLTDVSRTFNKNVSHFLFNYGTYLKKSFSLTSIYSNRFLHAIANQAPGSILISQVGHPDRLCELSWIWIWDLLSTYTPDYIQ